MIGFLRAILDALVRVLTGQAEAKADLDQLRADIDDQLASQSAAIEHLRELIEGDELPAAVGVPTFTPLSQPANGSTSADALNVSAFGQIASGGTP
jgi:hypothetical protein